MAKKKAVIKDWINRDEDYVHRGDLRSGWDNDYDSTSDYVLDGFLKPDTSEAEVREIQKLCANRASILADGKDIVFTINADEKTAKTDGKKVTVGTAVLDDPTKSFSDKADIMMGLTTHEMAHILHSSFSHLKEINNHMHKSILNVLEDERIEHILCEEFPGYATNLAKVKQYFLDEKYLIEEALKGGSISDEQRHAMELFDLFFKLVRYPKYIDLDKMSEYEMEIDEIKSILTPYPMTSKAVLQASKDVFSIIHKSIEKKTREEASGKTTEKRKSEESEGESKPGDMSGDMPESESPVESDGESVSEAAIKDKVLDIEQLIGDMMKDLDSDNDSSKHVEVSSSIKNIDFTKEFIYDPQSKATYRTGQGNKEVYEDYLRDVKGDAKRLANSLFIRLFSEGSVLRGLRSGNLDESKIVEAVHGVKTVHLQHSHKQTNKINIVLLIDESGSMGYGTKSLRYQDAAKAGIIIEQAFQTFPAGQLFIYGFTGDTISPDGKTNDYNQIIRYREPGLNVPYSLGSVKPRSQNRDGECIRSVAKRVREFTNEPMIFFVISDGCPHSTNYSGNFAMLDTKNAVKEITKMRFFPVQIGIGDGIKPEEQKMMFDDYVNYKDPRAMVDDLRKLIIRKSHKIFGIQA